ncbi:PilN domain-containing protein [Candidatus Kaiserbacteria bacterium]|nr:PilN domain-containing protein [Candidatus Kaiserbacteria bacterium]
MTNLLPPEDTKQLVRTAKAKFLYTGSFVIAAAAIAGIVALSPSFFLAYFSKADSGAETVPSGEEAQRRQDQEASSRVRALLAEISSVTEEKMPISEAIESAYVLRPPGVTIGAVAYAGGKPGTITLAGSAKSRENVSAFRDALAKSGSFENVSVPVGALVGALEGGFTITLTGNF